MKALLLVTLFSSTAWAAEALPAKQKNEFCMHLDLQSGFTRCMTQEVTCYLSKGGQQCWPNAKPSGSPSPAPSPVK